MATPSLAPSSQDYARAASKAGLEALYAGVWAAVGGLPAGKRRVVRIAIVAVTFAVGAVKEKAQQSDQPTSPVEQKADGSPSMTDQDQRRLATKFVLTAATGTALSVGRRQLRKRWLSGLSGHPHPHRALAVRMTALTFVLSLSRHLLTEVENRREASSAS